jgi:hypothetical protein
MSHLLVPLHCVKTGYVRFGCFVSWKSKRTEMLVFIMKEWLGMELSWLRSDK